MKFTEVAMFTEDVRVMGRFYEQLLGVAPVVRTPGLVIFASGQVKLLIHEVYRPGPGELPPEDHVSFKVADVDEACARLVRGGMEFEVEPRDFDWGRSAYLRDPDGRLLEITAEVLPEDDE